MPIVDTNVTDGPNVQADGQHRGTVEFIFGDGRVVTRNVRAPDANAWANLLADLPAEVEASQQLSDADEAVENDAEVADYKEANKKQLAVAYLRRAMSHEDPYVAYLKFSRFNDYRIAEGWNLNQVQAALMDAGLTEDEWNIMRDAYTWLSNAGRVTAMQAYQDVASGWTGMHL